MVMENEEMVMEKYFVKSVGTLIKISLNQRNLCRAAYLKAKQFEGCMALLS